jgi:hypothetical protein
MNILLALFLSSLLHAQTAPVCPAESFLIEFTSPVTGGKKSFCGYQKDGQTVKHGEEWSYERNGTLKTKISFQHGVEGGAETPVVGESPANVPGTEEMIISAIGEMLQVLTMRKSTAGKGMFKIDQCDSQPADWLKGALMRSPIPKTYAFSDSCDVRGSFTAVFGQLFQVVFDLRKLQDFSKTEMKLIMTFNISPSGVRYRIVVEEGSISSSSTNANFKVEYEVDINPLTGEAIKNSQQGKVSLTKLNGKEVKSEAPLFYDN